MDRRQLIDELQEIERSLRSIRVDNFVRQQDLRAREQFVAMRGSLTGLIEELRLAELADIERDMDRFAPELERGLSRLRDEIDRLQRVAALLDSVATIIDLVTRVVAFVA